MPKDRRRPQLPDATQTHVVEDPLTLAVNEPTLGCRQLTDRIGERGYRIGKTTVQKLLVDHGLGRRAQRVARAAVVRRSGPSMLNARPRRIEGGRHRPRSLTRWGVHTAGVVQFRLGRGGGPSTRSCRGHAAFEPGRQSGFTEPGSGVKEVGGAGRWVDARHVR